MTDALARRGFRDALVDIGELRAGDGDWRIAVVNDAGETLRTPLLRDSAVATSSPGALRLGELEHILSPTGDRPRWRTVSVEARSAALADGLSTALCLADLDAARTILRRIDGVASALFEDQHGDLVRLNA